MVSIRLLYTYCPASPRVAQPINWGHKKYWKVYVVLENPLQKSYVGYYPYFLKKRVRHIPFSFLEDVKSG